MARLLFDFPGRDGTTHRRMFERPLEVLQATSREQVLPALHAAGEAARSGCWVAGFVSYEAAPAFDDAIRTHERGHLPLLWLGIFDRVHPAPAAAAAPQAPALQWTPSTTDAQYDIAFARIREALLAGESYQVNYTTRLHATLPAGFDVEAACAALHRAQGHGYHADLDLGAVRILSASPELFFARSGRTITTRPMKGTHARGRWSGEDEALARSLLASEKERAENLMIVDLLRNDLGRIARTGTVRVPSLHVVERYPTVLQMTSTVTAELRDDCSLVDIFRALFPCGSVTGAPKISTMRLIRELEPAPREVYCGAIGVIEPGGDCTFSVPIRTMWIDQERGTAEYGVGSGITIDATALREAEELKEKSRILWAAQPDFSLIETMRLEDGRIARLERHLARLAESCAYFGWRFPEDEVRGRLAALCDEAPGAGNVPETGARRRRVRLTLSRTGMVGVDVAPMDEVECGSDLVQAEGGGGGTESSLGRARLRFIGIAPRAIDSRAVFVYHKTSLRSVYEHALAAAPGCFDVLLGNERDEATEFTRGNLVALIQGELVTPPRTAGLLAGCLRAELLEQGIVRERSIGLEEVRAAERLWFVNSLRGVVEVSPGSRAAAGA